jgi:hypothetical protein
MLPSLGIRLGQQYQLVTLPSLSTHFFGKGLMKTKKIVVNAES